ncbi:MAG: hypothetical protein J3K34DRAFT_400914 [Monoraphidium minutum]|nr:MAG: hypothetical protein J3K34DRAFT_400914 [Monoraphidium minutum]
MRRGSLLAALVAGLVLALPAQARMLRQVGMGRYAGSTGVAGTQGAGGDRGGFGYDNPLSYGTGLQQEAIVTGDASGTSSVGQIDAGDSRGSQAAAYARGMSRATGMTALGLAVAQEGDAGGANAAADAIRRQAGYQGSSFAGDIFGGGGGYSDESFAGAAIRRTQADNAALQARIGQRGQRYGSTSPFDI